MGSRAKPQPARPGGKPTGSGMNVQQVKVVLLGDQGVGKSSIALRFVRGEFLEHGEATIGAAFLTQTTKLDNHVIKFDIWDTAGQERYHSLAPMYYRGAQAAIVVYDVTSENSFKRALSWIKELQQQANSHIFVVLAGNKADMATEERAVPSEDARIFAEENDLFFVETSAKTGMGVSDVFMAVSDRLAGHSKKGGSQQQQRSNQNVRLREAEDGDKKKGGCC